MKILNTYRICDLRIDQRDEEWFLVDEGREDQPTIAQGTREQIAARVKEEMA